MLECEIPEWECDDQACVKHEHHQVSDAMHCTCRVRRHVRSSCQTYHLRVAFKMIICRSRWSLTWLPAP